MPRYAQFRVGEQAQRSYLFLLNLVYSHTVTISSNPNSRANRGKPWLSPRISWSPAYRLKSA